jgi:phospholipase/carboxylesterase
MRKEHAKGYVLTDQDNIHVDEPVLGVGPSLEEANAVMIMVHGRGASAQDILGLTTELSAEGMTFIAPQATGNTWYPHSFLESIQENEPYLSIALRRLTDLLSSVEEAGVPADRVILLGFSQGACLATEFAARNTRRFGGICGLSGGLIGPPGTLRDYPGSLDGTPVFLGCSDIDSHIPVERVYETEETLRALGGDVITEIYPGMGHTINQDEIEHVQRIVDAVLQEEGPK